MLAVMLLHTNCGCFFFELWLVVGNNCGGCSTCARAGRFGVVYFAQRLDGQVRYSKLYPHTTFILYLVLMMVACPSRPMQGKISPCAGCGSQEAQICRGENGAWGEGGISTPPSCDPPQHSPSYRTCVTLFNLDCCSLLFQLKDFVWRGRRLAKS